jgi:hypothetical protein
MTKIKKDIDINAVLDECHKTGKDLLNIKPGDFDKLIIKCGETLELLTDALTHPIPQKVRKKFQQLYKYIGIAIIEIERVKNDGKDRKIH